MFKLSVGSFENLHSIILIKLSLIVHYIGRFQKKVHYIGHVAVTFICFIHMLTKTESSQTAKTESTDSTLHSALLFALFNGS